jgi:dihydroorotase
MSTIFISKATLATSGDSVDVTVDNGIIRSIRPVGSSTAPSGATLIDAQGALLLPGLFDLHSHLGYPGQDLQQAVAQTAASALQGGVTGLQAMPDCSPVLDHSAQIKVLNEVCREQGNITIVPTGCITKGTQGEEQVPYDSLRAQGVRFVTDGVHVPSNTLLLYRAMQYAAPLGITFALRGDVPELTSKGVMHPSSTSYKLGLHGLPACAEEIGIESMIRLAEATEARLHVQTVSTAEGAQSIRRWKARRSELSAEVALHHLIFTHENVGDYDTTFKTLPPLRESADVVALQEALTDGTIDCIVSDHTPVTPFSKLQDFCVAPQGMLALDTYLPALYTYLVKTGVLDWKQLIVLCSTNPRRLMNLQEVTLTEGSTADFVLFDPNKTFEITADSLKSRTLNSPFLGKSLNGRVLVTYTKGQLFQF